MARRRAQWIAYQNRIEPLRLVFIALSHQVNRRMRVFHNLSALLVIVVMQA